MRWNFVSLKSDGRDVSANEKRDIIEGRKRSFKQVFLLDISKLGGKEIKKGVIKGSASSYS